MQRSNHGFTLVELAVVLVIIGLLIGGVLKGQELVDSAKAKNMAGDFRTFSALVYSYQDRYRALPGDQSQAQLDAAFGAGQASACSPAAAGHCANGNNRVDGDWNAGAASAESYVFWQHVRLANLLPGSTDTGDTAYLPRNADGGRIGIESGLNAAGVAAPYISGMRGSFYLCSDNVLGRYARRIDTMLDDGNTAGGSLRIVPSGSARGSAATAGAAVEDGQSYTVCAAF